MADLRVTVDGLTLPNPFVIGSGPPGTNANFGTPSCLITSPRRLQFGLGFGF